ncbi:MAG: integrase [Rhodomicrobium sp.]|nr:integrase [Rhodomicrobium sp.]
MNMERFFGGTPAAVILKLAIASVIIGVVLSFFGFNPANLYDAIMRLGDWISSLGLDAVKTVLRYLVLGAIIVVPLWLLSRVFSLFSERRQKQD